MEFIEVLVAERGGLQKKGSFQGFDNGHVEIWLLTFRFPLEKIISQAQR